MSNDQASDDAANGNGTVDDFKWLVAREIPYLRRYARTLTKDAERADDLVQDCMERALKKRHLWWRRGSLRGWLLKMLYHIHLNGHRQRAREQAQVDIDDAVALPSHLTSAEHRLECRRVGVAMDRLPQEQRDALVLVSLEGLAYDEAAWVLGIPIGTLRSRISRARDTLRAAIADDPGKASLRRVK